MIVEISLQSIGVKEREPFGEIREESGVRVAVEAILLVAGVTPVHVETVHAERELTLLPHGDIVLSFGLSVAIPISKPGTERKVRKQWSRSNQLHELLAGREPIVQSITQKEDVVVSVLVVGEVVAIGICDWRRETKMRSRTPGRYVESREVDNTVGLLGERRRPLELVKIFSSTNLFVHFNTCRISDRDFCDGGYTSVSQATERAVSRKFGC